MYPSLPLHFIQEAIRHCVPTPFIPKITAIVYLLHLMQEVIGHPVPSPSYPGSYWPSRTHFILSRKLRPLCTQCILPGTWTHDMLSRLSIIVVPLHLTLEAISRTGPSPFYPRSFQPSSTLSILPCRLSAIMDHFVLSRLSTISYQGYRPSWFHFILPWRLSALLNLLLVIQEAIDHRGPTSYNYGGYQPSCTHFMLSR